MSAAFFSTFLPSFLACMMSPTPHRSRIVAGCAFVLVTAVASCAKQPEHGLTGTEALESCDVATILKNMPVNSSHRCVGIAAVVEALLDGELAGGNHEDALEQLAKQIYESLITGQRIRYGRYVVTDGKRLAVDSKEALERLSTMVADLYKADYHRLTETELGTRSLIEAQAGHVQTREELGQLLDRDMDKTKLFFACGKRSFPDGTVEQTHHVVLICKGPSNEISVVDPNDPGRPIPCDIEIGKEGLAVQWVCQYKDTGLITTQRYRIIPRERYVGAVLRTDSEGTW